VQTSEPVASGQALRVLQTDPLAAECPLPAQQEFLTPTPLFYIRNHFPIPDLTPEQWRLRVDGLVERPLTLSLADLRQLPARAFPATLECAGNGRALLEPPAPGLQFHYGAVSTAEWRGVPLRTVLDLAGLQPGAREVVCIGADGGFEKEVGAQLDFRRSLPLEKALAPETLLAYEMNGAPLTPEHGFPLRLVVPGWYGMASVKWLVGLRVVADSFDGWFQRDRYVLDPAPDGGVAPLTRLRVKSHIAWPTAGERLPVGRHRVRGMAWSGEVPVVRVEVSTDRGATWHPAALSAPVSPFAWQPWTFDWEVAEPGAYELWARATDARGESQPLRPSWNRLGYANNAVHRVPVHVVTA